MVKRKVRNTPNVILTAGMKREQKGKVFRQISRGRTEECSPVNRVRDSDLEGPGGQVSVEAESIL